MRPEYWKIYSHKRKVQLSKSKVVTPADTINTSAKKPLKAIAKGTLKRQVGVSSLEIKSNPKSRRQL